MKKTFPTRLDFWPDYTLGLTIHMGVHFGELCSMQILKEFDDNIGKIFGRIVKA